MAYPTKLEVQKILSPYHTRIRAVVDRAWDEWRSVEAHRSGKGYGPVMYSRTMANFMFDAIARNAHAEFGPDASIHVRVESQTIKFFYGGRVVARYKKGNGNKLGQNILTQAVLSFINQDAVLPGLPPETIKVEFVWVPNDLGTKIESVLVVARHENTLLWRYDIDAEVAGKVITLFPAAADGDTDATASGLVKPKSTRIKAETSDSE